jgi:hypothetical protein
MLIAAGHFATAGAWTTKDTVIFVALAVVLGVPLVAISLIRVRRAGEYVRASLQQAGYEVVQLQYRFLRWGPYAWTTNQRSQTVYRVVVREHGGRERHGWARWGRPWFWLDDKLEFRWDD